MLSKELNPKEYDPYYQSFIDLNTQHTLLENLEYGLRAIELLSVKLTEAVANTSYAKGKWTIKEVLVHLIDVERIFSYRALSIARGEQSNLPSFDQDLYVINSNANNRTCASLLEEFSNTRRATISLFKGFSDSALKNIGQAGGAQISVRALGFIITGHHLHHFNVIDKKYLNL